jgi:hypothetical protein
MKKNTNLSIILLLIVLLQSCALTLPSSRRTSVNTNVTVSDPAQQVEALKRDEYVVLGKAKGKASTQRFYFLFIPIGKMKNDAELYENAYFDAVSNCDSCDAVLLPRRKNTKLTIPLLLINYQRKAIEVQGVGIKVKTGVDKI